MTSAPAAANQSARCSVGKQRTWPGSSVHVKPEQRNKRAVHPDRETRCHPDPVSWNTTGFTATGRVTVSQTRARALLGEPDPVPEPSLCEWTVSSLFLQHRGGL